MSLLSANTIWAFALITALCYHAAFMLQEKNHKKSHFDVDTPLDGCTMATMSNRTIRISKASHSIITRWRVRTGLPRSRVADEAITLANQLWAATGFVLNGNKRKEGKR